MARKDQTQTLHINSRRTHVITVGGVSDLDRRVCGGSVVGVVSVPWLFHDDSSMTVSCWQFLYCYMTVPWPFHDCSMTLPWLLHDCSMTARWLFHDRSMTVPWLFHDDCYMTDIQWCKRRDIPRTSQHTFWWTVQQGSAFYVKATCKNSQCSTVMLRKQLKQPSK